MYQSLLTLRYLTTKVMPLLAVAAVTLCAAMVLTVWSVMAGFLTMLLSSGRTLMGDVIIYNPVVGIAYYDDLLDRLRDDPMIEAATPTIEAPGLLRLPGDEVRMVQVVGVEGPSYNRVTGYADAVWWQPIDEPIPKDEDREDLRLRVSSKYLEDALTLTETDPETGLARPAVVLGIEVTGFNHRLPSGVVMPRYYGFMPEVGEVTLSVLPISRRGAAITGTMGVEARRFPVANEFRTGLYDFDASTVLLRIDALQEMLRMSASKRVDAAVDLSRTVIGPDGRERFISPEVEGEEPARVTNIMVRARPGVTPLELQPRVREIYEAFAAARSGSPVKVPDPGFIPIQTWEQRPGIRTFVAAVKKETALVLGLFVFISITAAFLICAIFWAMVSEKTRDIGVLRAIGASRLGVAGIYLSFGLAIGLVGSGLGIGLAWLLVHNINPVHEWLGRVFGVLVWDPSVYYFTTIPNHVEPVNAAFVALGGVTLSVLGALLPAFRAARMDPIRALRFE